MSNMIRRPIFAGTIAAALAWALFLVRLAVPHKLVFDEVHYVPAARTLLALREPVNIEHPLLAKEFIAAGIALFGDGPIGWRFSATVAGAATIGAVFAILQQTYGRLRTSAFGTALVLLNFTVFVQARIAMLDGYMAAFLFVGAALFLRAMRRGGWGWWIAAGVSFGLAIACKWTALPLIGGCGLAFLWIKRETPDAFPGIGPLAGPAAMAAVALVAYLATFAPAFFYASDPLTLARLLPFQAEMYARQTQVLPPHTYQSPWWSWPIDKRPIWYLYEVADGAQRGILMLGNPVVMWGGLGAIAACQWGWIKSGDPRLLAASLAWLVSVLMWVLIPKSLGFYYYYYVSSILICLAIAAAFDHWRERAAGWDLAFGAGALVAFVWFFPILAALPLDGPDAFRRWTWFASWI